MESPLAQAPSQTCPLADASIDNTTPTSISVNCGIVTGELFPDKLKGVRASNWGSVKCILSNSVWCTPIEFECQGGKPKSRNWRRSIYQVMSNWVPISPPPPSYFLSAIILHPSLDLLVPTLTGHPTLD